jgi:RNA polymerase sigma factor (TIGR02999 family)
MSAEVTQLLNAIDEGDPRAAEELLPLVYEELRLLASAKMARESPGQTLQATALVHEAWLKLVGREDDYWQNRAHFFAAAAESMRRILIDRARRKARQRHGGSWQRVDIEKVIVTVAVDDADETILAINDVLELLAKKDEQKARIVKLRYFVGMGHAEISEVLGISEATVRRHWAFARSWLYTELTSEEKNRIG